MSGRRRDLERITVATWGDRVTGTVFLNVPALRARTKGGHELLEPRAFARTALRVARECGVRSLLVAWVKGRSGYD